MRHTVNQSKSQSNTENESYDFKIGDAAVVIDILRNKLYSDKIRVLVQEYLCNARDAMREARNTQDKIEVTLPTRKNPTIKIRDFGPGLSPDRVQEVFVQFGRSTKRNSDEQTGGFGLGGKSAFAYTESFLVMSVFGGTETHYVAHLGKNAVGTLEKVYQAPTTSKAGVEIQIGVSMNTEELDESDLDDLTRFHHAVYRTIAFWDKGEMPVIKNESDAESSEWMELADRIARGDGLIGENYALLTSESRNRYHGSSCHLVVDGILYELDSDDFESKEHELFSANLDGSTTAYLMLKSGQVEVAASREAVVVNQKNAQVIKGVFKLANKELTQDVKNTITQCTTLSETKTTLFKLRGVTGSARMIVREVQGVAIDFEDGSLSRKDGYMAFDISARSYSSRVKINEHATPQLSGFFLLNDSELAESTLKAKVKQLFQSDNSRRHFVIIAKEKAEVAALLNAVPVSTLKTRTERQYDSKRGKLPDGYVTLRTVVYSSYKSPSLSSDLVKLSEVTDRTYVVIADAQEKADIVKYAALQELINESGGDIKFCFPSKTALKQVIGQKAFIAQDDFFSDIAKSIGKKAMKKIVKTLEDDLVVASTKVLPVEISELSKQIPEIKDPKIVAGLQMLASQKPIADRVLIDQAILEDELVKKCFEKDLQAVAPIIDFATYFKDSYGFLLDQYFEESVHVVYYMNGKYGMTKTA